MFIPCPHRRDLLMRLRIYLLKQSHSKSPKCKWAKRSNYVNIMKEGLQETGRGSGLSGPHGNFLKLVPGKWITIRHAPDTSL